MISHAKAVELAATAIDFELDRADRTALDAHLSGCAPCRRDVTTLSATAREIERLAARPAPARVRSTVLAAATASSASHNGPLPWLAPRLDVPVGVGLAAAALVALLVATLIAGLLSGGRPPFQAVVVAPATAVPPDPTPAPVPTSTAYIATAIEVCRAATDLVAAGGALWVRCPDATVSNVNPRTLAIATAALGVQAIVPGSSSAWSSGPTAPSSSTRRRDDIWLGWPRRPERRASSMATRCSSSTPPPVSCAG